MSTQRPSTPQQHEEMLGLLRQLSELNAAKCISFVGSVVRRQRQAPPKYLQEENKAKAQKLSAEVVMPGYGGNKTEPQEKALRYFLFAQEEFNGN